MKTFLLVALATMTAMTAKAQEVVKLWDNLAPGAIESADYKEITVYADKEKTKPRIARVTDPTITIFSPADSVENKHVGVVICPGGGYGRLSFDTEGVEIAKAFASRGITSFVLKYRLPSDKIMADRCYGPISDALRAISIARSRAKELDIMPNKIGIMGFSAGGNLAATTSTLFGLPELSACAKDTFSTNPNFTILGYPVISLRKGLTHGGTRALLVGGKDNEEEMATRFSADENVSKQTPPAFLFHCSDDPAVPPANSIRYFSALRENGINAELHIFTTGGHGFGLGLGARKSAWFDMACSWIEENIQ